MAGSAKQRRFVQAIEHDPKFADKGQPPISTPGGVVASGGYLDGMPFKKTSLLPMRKR